MEIYIEITLAMKSAWNLPPSIEKYPLIIDRFFDNLGMGNSTGFLFRHNDESKWLVTAKHILFSRENNGRPFHRMYVGSVGTAPSRRLKITLGAIQKFGMVHVKEKVDVVAIRISELLDQNYFASQEFTNFKCFDASTVVDQVFGKGSSVCVIGYPERDDWNKASLERLCGRVIPCRPEEKVIVKEPNILWTSMKSCFCIDQPAVGGLSGSPVIIANNDNNSVCKLAGICVARLENEDDGSSSGAVEPSHYIKDIVEHGRDLASSYPTSDGSTI